MPDLPVRSDRDDRHRRDRFPTPGHGQKTHSVVVRVGGAEDFMTDPAPMLSE